MRIFLAYHPSGNLSVPNSNTWFKNLHAPLLDLGHELFVLKLDEFSKQHNVRFRSEKYKEIMSNELKKIFYKEHAAKPFDIFFSYFNSQDIEKSVLLELKKAGVLLLNFSCNNTHQFHLVKNISECFDYNLHSEKDAKEKFIKAGANPVWFPMAANPRYYYPEHTSFKYDVSFVGAAYAKRAIYINFLVQNRIGIDCFGPNWLINKPYATLKRINKELSRLSWLLQSSISISNAKRVNLDTKIFHYDLLANLRVNNKKHFHYPVSDSEMINIFNQSKINLGFLEVFSDDNQQTTQQHLHLREFEIPMSGGLYITNYSEELAEFYELDKEILAFRNEYELVEKIKYYLSHDQSADKIRKAAYSRALKDHTCQIRFQRLFKQLNLK